MELYIQASTHSKGYSWVKVLPEDTSFPVLEPCPNDFQKCVSLIDLSSPSLVVAYVTNDQKSSFVLLASGLEANSTNSRIRIPANLLYAIFDPDQEKQLRALAISLADSQNTTVEDYRHNIEVSYLIDKFIVRTESQKLELAFSVKEGLIKEINSLIDKYINQVSDSKEPQQKILQPSLENKSLLTNWIKETPLPKDSLKSNFQPIIVVTSNKLSKKIVDDGAWFVMTNLLDQSNSKSKTTTDKKSTTSQNKNTVDIKIIDNVKEFNSSFTENDLKPLKKWFLEFPEKCKPVVEHINKLPIVLKKQMNIFKQR